MNRRKSLQKIKGRVFYLLLPFLLLPAFGFAESVQEILDSAAYESGIWNFEESVELYNKALELEPENAEIYYLRAAALSETGEKEKAISDYSKALELGIKKNDVYFSRGMLYEYTQKYQLAVDDLTIFLQTEPMDYMAYYLRAGCRYQLKDFEGAIADYSKAIELVPDDPDIAQTYYFRAFAYSDNGEYEKALNDFEKAQELDPGNGKIAYRIIRVKSKSGNFEESLQACNELIEANDSDLEAYFIRSEIYLEQSKFQLAIEDLDHILDLYPIPEAYYLRGKAKVGKGEKNNALIDYNKALEMNPDYPECKKAIENL